MDTRPFCANGCKDRLRCKKNDVYIRYGNEDRPAELGDSVVNGDLWECPGCGHQIVRGWALRPWDPNLDPKNRDLVFRIALAIDAAPKGFVAFSEVVKEKAPA